MRDNKWNISGREKQRNKILLFATIHTAKNKVTGFILGGVV